MNDELALRLRALGAGFNLPLVQALYAPLLCRHCQMTRSTSGG